MSTRNKTYFTFQGTEYCRKAKGFMAHMVETTPMGGRQDVLLDLQAIQRHLSSYPEFFAVNRSKDHSGYGLEELQTIQHLIRARNAIERHTEMRRNFAATSGSGAIPGRRNMWRFLRRL